MSNTCRSSSMWCCSDAVIPAQAGIQFDVDPARHQGGCWEPGLLSFASVSASPMNTRAFALCASHFSLLVQRKVTKRKHTPAACPPRVPRCGSASGTGIFGRHIHVPSENAAHRARRPLGVLPMPAALPQGPRRSKGGSKGRSKGNGRSHRRIHLLSFPIPRSAFPGCQR